MTMIAPSAAAKPSIDLGDEVRVAGRVDQRDPRPVALERPDREAQRLAPLLLLGLEVEVGRAVIDPTQSRDGPGLEHELLRQRRLARADMAREDDAAKVGEVDALHRHRGSTVLLMGVATGGRGGSEGSSHHSRLYSGPRCQVIPSGPRSSARRASPTPSVAPFHQGRARDLRSRRARAAATRMPTTGFGSPSRRRAR